MPTLCIICKNSTSLHLFPKNQELREEWMNIIGLTQVRMIATPRICIKHFQPDDYYISKNKTYLYPGRVPSIFEDIHGLEIKIPARLKEIPNTPENELPEFNELKTTNLPSFCFVCLKNEGILSIYDETNYISLAKKIESFVDVIITRDLCYYPRSVCQNCALKVDDCYNLKMQCEDSIKTFIMLQNKNNVLTEKIEHVNINSEFTDSHDISKPELQDSDTSNNIQLHDSTQSTNNFLNEIKDEPPIVLSEINAISIEGSEIVFAEELNIEQNVTMENEKTYECDKCPKKFIEQIKLIKHKRIHKQFICQICGRQLKSSKTLTSHIASHNNEKEKPMHKCEECGKVFKYLSVLREHEILHTSATPYECDKCDKKFQQKIRLSRHMNFHKEENKIICEICSRQFHSIQNLNRHKLIHGPSKYKCSECNKLFNTASGLRSHFLRHKGIRYSCDQCDLTFSGRGSLSTHKKSIHMGIKNYKCVICGKEYFNSYNHKQHVLSHTGEKPHACEICHKKFTQRSVLLAHLDKLHNIKTDKRNVSKKDDKIHECNICKKILSNSENLKKHLKIHTVTNSDNTKNLQCQICNKTLSNTLTLRYHMRIHSGDKSYECQICKKKFVSLDSRKLHLRIHTGEKPFQCKLCPEAFISKSKCVIHERKHTGITPYQCVICPKYFNDKPHLEIHMRVHTGEKPYKCTYCDKTFAATGNRDAHIRVHTGEKAYTCKQCDAQFNRLKVLRKHVEKVHPKEVEYS